MFASMSARSNYDATKRDKANPHFGESMDTREQNKNARRKIGGNKGYYRGNKKEVK